MDANGPSGLWQADWTGAGLAEGYYRILIKATDRAGHLFVDDSLRFSDPIAGIAAPGTDAYPNGGMRGVQDGIDGLFRCAVIDQAAGYAYFGTDSVPGAVVKVKLGTGSSPPRKVGTLLLNEREDKLYAAAIDTVHGYAYFCSFEGDRVIKIALRPGDALPVRIGAVLFPPEEHELSSAVIDPERGYAYIGTSDNFLFGAAPGKVVKIALGAGDTSPTRVGSVTMGAAENLLMSATIDPAAGYAYFAAGSGIGQTGSYCVKVALGSGNTSPTRLGALSLGSRHIPMAAVIDPASKFAYMTGDSPAHPGTVAVMKIALGAGNALPTLAGYVETPAASGSAAIDLAAQEALFAGASGSIYKIALGTGNLSPSIVGTANLLPEESPADCAVWNTADHRAIFASFTGPGRLIEIDGGSAGSPPARLGSQQLFAIGAPVGFSFIDPVRRYAYFGNVGQDIYREGGAGPAVLSKAALPSGSSSLRWIGSIPFSSSGGVENSIPTIFVIDSTKGYAYIGRRKSGNGPSTQPAAIYKIALGEGDSLPRIVSSLALPAGEDLAYSATIDPAAGYAYFAASAASQANRIVKVALGAGDTSPTRIGACALASAEGNMFISGIDPVGKRGYFANGRYLVKISLGDGDTSPTRLGAASLPARFGTNQQGGVIDPDSGRAWIATRSSIGAAVHKLALGAGNAAPRETGFLELNPGLFDLGSASNQAASVTEHPSSIDKEGGFAILGGIVKIGLGDGDSTPTLIGRLDPAALPANLGLIRCAYDEASGFAYASAGTYSLSNYIRGGSNVLRYGYSQKGFVKTAKIGLFEKAAVQSFSFYSHRAAGHLRLGLYREDSPSVRTLLWESASTTNTAANGFAQIPIASGNPSALRLEPGTYHLAWQIDATADVPSLTVGAQGDGSYLLQDYGAFPAQMKAGDAATGWTATSETWTGYLSYQTITGVPREAWAGY